jgi:glycosyltransferase involved in cell wall biosynthesis
MTIKVFIEKNMSKGGPAIFRDRLSSALNKIKDIEVVNNIDDKFDIGIEFIRKTHKYKQPYILRTSSCYYFKNYKPWNNKPIAKSIKNADHVIFQSNFAYKLLNRVLRLESRSLIKNNYSIIYNGVDIEYINNIKPSDGIESGSFVACARWDGNKRLHSMVKGFLEADIKKHLYVIGYYGIEDRKKDFSKLKNKYKSKYIHFLGEKTNKEVISIMKACDYQIHMAFIDICPNIVIEGLSCGLNILCTNLGGTSELVGNNGVVLKVDKFWDTRYLKKRIEDLDNLKSNIVVEGIHKMIKNKITPDTKAFNIDTVSKKYIKIIKKVMK